MQKDLVEVDCLLIHLQFRSNPVTAQLEDDGLRIFFDATDEWILEDPRRFRISPDANFLEHLSIQNAEFSTVFMIILKTIDDVWVS